VSHRPLILFSIYYYYYYYYYHNGIRHRSEHVCPWPILCLQYSMAGAVGECSIISIRSAGSLHIRATQNYRAPSLRWPMFMRKRCLITYHFTISRYQQTFVGRSVFDLLCTTGSRGFFFNFFNVSNSKLSSTTALQIPYRRRLVMYISLCINIVYSIISLNLMVS